MKFPPWVGSRLVLNTVYTVSKKCATIHSFITLISHFWSEMQNTKDQNWRNSAARTTITPVCCKFLGEYDSERILKIDQHCHSYERMYSGTVFLTHCVVAKNCNKFEHLSFSRYCSNTFLCFDENLTDFPAVKEFWKSVKTWRYYRHNRVARFLRHSICLWLNHSRRR